MPHVKKTPAALPAPQTPVTAITTRLLDDAVAHSRKSPRKRIVLPLHKSADAPLHRMLNAVQPGTYVRPHRHASPPKAECFVVLRGALRVVVFDEQGSIVGWDDLRPEGQTIGIDVEPGIFHGLIALEPDTVLLEVKPGPYTQADDKDFAPWAPPEGDIHAGDYLDELTAATSSRQA